MKDLLDKASEYRAIYEIVGRGHYIAADHKRALNRLLGVPVIFITAAVGSTIFVTFDKSPEPSLRIVAGLVAMAGTILSSLQTLLGFAQDAEKHKTVGGAYRAVSRSFEMFSLKYAEAGLDQRQGAFAELDAIVRGLKDLPTRFPTLPDRFYNKAKKEHDALMK